MPQTTHSLPSQPSDAKLPRWVHWMVGATTVLAALGVFALYQRPDFLMTVANQLWTCF